MNRRTLMAGMAAMIPATVGAQATHDAQGGAASDIMRSYLETIIRDGDLGAIPDLFSDTLDLSFVTWDHAEMQSDARHTGEAFTLDIRLMFGDDVHSLAYVHYGPPDIYRHTLFVAIRIDDGKITSYNWAQQLI